jgi:hypothetical protein
VGLHGLIETAKAVDWRTVGETTVLACVSVKVRCRGSVFRKIVLIEQIAFNDSNLPGRALRTGRQVHEIGPAFRLKGGRAFKKGFAQRQRDEVLFAAVRALK